MTTPHSPSDALAIARIEETTTATYLVLGEKRMYLAGQYDGLNQRTIEAIREACAVAGLTDSDSLAACIDEAMDASDGAEAVYLVWDEEAAR